jgi:hypothetical protein
MLALCSSERLAAAWIDKVYPVLSLASLAKPLKSGTFPFMTQISKAEKPGLQVVQPTWMMQYQGIQGRRQREDHVEVLQRQLRGRGCARCCSER